MVFVCEFSNDFAASATLSICLEFQPVDPLVCKVDPHHTSGYYLRFTLRIFTVCSLSPEIRFRQYLQRKILHNSFQHSFQYSTIHPLSSRYTVRFIDHYIPFFDITSNILEAFSIGVNTVYYALSVGVGLDYIDIA